MDSIWEFFSDKSRLKITENSEADLTSINVKKILRNSPRNHHILSVCTTRSTYAASQYTFLMDLSLTTNDVQVFHTTQTH